MTSHTVTDVLTWMNYCGVDGNEEKDFALSGAAGGDDHESDYGSYPLGESGAFSSCGVHRDFEYVSGATDWSWSPRVDCDCDVLAVPFCG